jgi:hypothetical protein
VHIEPGNYSINTALVVPAGSDMQIVGDGFYSQLTWAGMGTGPVMQLQGPSKATLRDFQVYGSYSGDGIEVDNVDQPGSSVFMEEAWLAGSATDLFVDALDDTNVQLHDSYHHGSLQTGQVAVNVIGGPKAVAGSWQGGATNIFAGASYGENLSYEVSNGGHVGERDVCYDSGDGGGQLTAITGTSTFAYAGSLFALGHLHPYAASSPIGCRTPDPLRQKDQLSADSSLQFTTACYRQQGDCHPDRRAQHE